MTVTDLHHPVEHTRRARPVQPPAAGVPRWVRLVGEKVLRAVAVVWAAYTIAFLLLFVLPGDAVLARIGTTDAVGATELAAVDLEPLRHELGLEDTLLTQYGSSLLGLVTGDLGDSLVTGEPVVDLIAEALPNTLVLAGISLLVSLVVGVGLAVAAVAPRSARLRSAVAMIPAAYVSLPVFWVGVLLIYVFSLQLGWAPSSGSQGAASLVLPAAVLGMLGAAQFAQVLISSLRTELATSYAAVTAPAKGATRLYTVTRHCLRNAALPFLTVFGLRVGSLLGGTVVIEMVFSRSGIGRLMVDAVRSVDLTVVLGIVVLLAVVYVVVNTLVDIGYGVIDPRLRRRSAPAAIGATTSTGTDGRRDDGR